MNSFVDKLLCRKHDEEESSGDELFDKDATNLSHVGEAVHQALGRQHNRLHHSQWNVTSGRVIGSVDQTPKIDWNATTDPVMDNDDWFSEKLADIIGRTEAFCDVMSLGPPDGKFLVAFKGALLKLAERSRTSEKPIIVRFLFGNIAGKSAFVLFCRMNLCLQYEVSVTWPLHLNFICHYLIAFATHVY